MLSIDLDEFLTFSPDVFSSPQSFAIASYTRAVREEGWDGSTFGSATDKLSIACDDDAGKNCLKLPPTYDEITCTQFYTEDCAPYFEGWDHRRCPFYCGHRKHLIYGPRALETNIHQENFCRMEPCKVKAESTDDIWLRHFNGQNLTENRCPSCLGSLQSSFPGERIPSSSVYSSS